MQILGVWREAGFVLFEMDDATMTTLDAAFDAAFSYFALPQLEKDACTSSEVYFGYQKRLEFDKELFQVGRSVSSLNVIHGCIEHT